MANSPWNSPSKFKLVYSARTVDSVEVTAWSRSCCSVLYSLICWFRSDPERVSDFYHLPCATKTYAIGSPADHPASNNAPESKLKMPRLRWTVLISVQNTMINKITNLQTLSQRGTVTNWNYSAWRFHMCSNNQVYRAIKSVLSSWAVVTTERISVVVNSTG